MTVKQYRECVLANKCNEPLGTYEDGDTFNYNAIDRDDHPINGVSWQQAYDYCTWAGKRLPTNAEWEKAARGTDGSAYPWGNEEPSCDYATIRMPRIGIGRGLGRTNRVGAHPDGVSSFGAHDMAGNVYEWVNDWYRRDYYSQSSRRDSQGAATGSSKVIRGGSWENGRGNLARTLNRRSSSNDQGDHIGFRCAKSSR